MKKVYLAFILLTFMLIRIYPQSITKESIFSDLDTTRLSTGILYNLFNNKDLYARFDGINVTECSTSERWMTLYRELFYASLRSTTLQPPTDVFDSIISKTILQKVSIGIINRKCDSIKSYAFTNDLLRFDNNKIYDGDNTSESPYLNLRCFSGAVLTDTVYSNNVQFLFSDQFNFIEPNENIEYLRVDFGDGNGLITINENEERNVSYANYGLKNIIIEVHTNIGTYKSNTKLMVLSNPVGLRSAPTDADTSSILPIQGPHPNEKYKGTYKIWYGENNVGPNIYKPLILVEGLDPQNENDFDKIWGFANKNQFLDTIRSLGYDIIILNFNDANIKIQSNAMVLEELIQHINETKASNEEIVILGASLGGLITRYALAHMESHNIEHHTRLFASLDTPHEGAYYSISAQFLLSQLIKSCNSNWIIKSILYSKLKSIFNILTCDAAKQMLVYHYQACVGLFQTNDYSMRPHQLHKDLFGDMFSNNIGEFKTLTTTGFPQKCKNISLSCGSGESNFQPGHDNDINSSHKYIDVDDTTSNADIMLKMACLTALNPDPDPDTILYLDLKYGFWASHFQKVVSDPNLTNITINAGCCYSSYDGAPGGNYPLVKSLLNEIKNNLGVDYSYSGTECLVPSTSALALNCGLNENIHTTFGFTGDSLDVDNYLPNNHGPLVFDAMFIGEDNLTHLTGDNSFSVDMKRWLTSQITKEDEFIQNKTISGATKRYESYKRILAGNNVTTGQTGNVIIQNNSDIKFVAGEIIKLGPGFKVILGSKFKAEIKN